jgi:GTPase
MFIQSWSDVVKASAKLIMFVDLAGHKKYLKTTLFGLSSQVPDYVMVAIDAVQGLTIATSEHLYVLFALRVPVFIVITKLDLASTETLQALIDQVIEELFSSNFYSLCLFCLQKMFRSRCSL